MNERMKITPEGEPAMNNNEGLAYINVVRQKIEAVGGNDSERDELQSIAEQMLRGDISPLEACKAADRVFESKQDYH